MFDLEMRPEKPGGTPRGDEGAVLIGTFKVEKKK
jgi:hypothetical protein